MPGGGRRQADEWDSANKFAVMLKTASLSEAELRRKEKTLTQAAALLVLAKKYRVFPALEDEDV